MSTLKMCDKFPQYQTSGAGGTRSPPATPHRLQHLPRPLYPKWPMGSGNRANLRLLDPPTEASKSKMAARGPKMADGVWKGVQS